MPMKIVAKGNEEGPTQRVFLFLFVACFDEVKKKGGGRGTSDRRGSGVSSHVTVVIRFAHFRRNGGPADQLDSTLER